MQPTFATQQALAANAEVDSGWIANGAPSGANSIVISSLSDQASAASGVIIEQSDDPGNSALPGISLTKPLKISQAAANQQLWLQSAVTRRFWRVRYINGATAQTNFQLLVTATGDPQLSILLELQRVNFNLFLLRETSLKATPQDRAAGINVRDEYTDDAQLFNING